MKKQLFQFKEVPADWALCFQDACPLHEECQRWLAGSYAPKKMTVRPYSYKVFALSGHCFLLTVLLSRRGSDVVTPRQRSGLGKKVLLSWQDNIVITA